MSVKVPEAEPHPGLISARVARAVGPGPGAEELRRAYLELLKLCLCDLHCTTTVSVGRTEGGVVASRELSGEQLRLRAAGMDWPLQGLTMVGLKRLDDLQRCVESVVEDEVPGDLIEAGTWRGGASMLMRATLDTLGDETRTVWVADSFQGFPAGEGRDEEWSAMEFLRVPAEEVRENFARLGLERGIRLHPGFFEDTLAGLSDRRWAIVRLDADTYESTMVTLEALYPGLATGGYLIVDDFGALAECRRAVGDFRERHGIREPLEEVDWTCVRWRREDGGPVDEHRPAPEAAAPDPELDATPPPRPHVPTFRELELVRELGSLRARLASAEKELARLRNRPLAAPAEWLRRKANGRTRP